MKFGKIVNAGLLKIDGPQGRNHTEFCEQPARRFRAETAAVSAATTDADAGIAS